MGARFRTIARLYFVKSYCQLNGKDAVPDEEEDAVVLVAGALVAAVDKDLCIIDDDDDVIIEILLLRIIEGKDAPPDKKEDDDTVETGNGNTPCIRDRTRDDRKERPALFTEECIII